MRWVTEPALESALQQSKFGLKGVNAAARTLSPTCLKGDNLGLTVTGASASTRGSPALGAHKYRAKAR